MVEGQLKGLPLYSRNFYLELSGEKKQSEKLKKMIR